MIEKIKGFFGRSNKAFAIASTVASTATILEIYLKLAHKNPKVAEKFLKYVGCTIAIVGGVVVTVRGAKQYGDAKAYRSNRLADADEYTIKRMADAMLEHAKRENGRGSSVNTEGNDSYSADCEYIGERQRWSEWFSSKFKMPELPPFIAKLMCGVPNGYEDAMLLHILSMLGAMCFSKVRAVYLDKTVHAPNLQVIVEGNWGAGKAKFEQMYKVLFDRVIESDIQKINSMDDEEEDEDDEHVSRIIQTTGIGTSMSKLVDILAENKECHTYFFNSEVRALANDLKKSNGLTFDYLRKAFENGDVCRNNKAKNSVNGIFSIYMNYTITGTPMDIRESFKKELEGGTLSRVCLSTIPEAGREPGVLNLPKESELNGMRDLIDEWREKFCYKSSYDGDIAVGEHHINLDYVNEVLESWSKDQWDIAEEEGNPARKDVRLRIATMAFHCAIVLHMLWGDKQDLETRNKVKNLTIYIANYCMERFLFKYGDEQNRQRKQSQDAEYMKSEPEPSPANPTSTMSPVEQEAVALKALYDQGKGQRKIAQEFYGSNEDKCKKRVKNLLNRYYPDIVWGNARTE